MAKAKPSASKSAGGAHKVTAPARPAKPANTSAPRKGTPPKKSVPKKLPKMTATKTLKSTPKKAAKPAPRKPDAGPKAAKPVKAAAPVKARPAAAAARPKGKAAPRKLRYQVKQPVVYPLHGVGQVLRIEERPFLDHKLLYYIIYIEVSDMTVMVPVDKADGLGIRPIVDRKESAKALKLVSDTYEPVPTDWKMRYQMNLDLLKSGSIVDIATVVRTLYHRSKIKELPILERKLYDSAMRLLIDEVSLSLDKEK
jgi:CarD family transcriptional regulator